MDEGPAQPQNPTRRRGTTIAAIAIISCGLLGVVINVCLLIAVALAPMTLTNYGSTVLTGFLDVFSRFCYAGLGLALLARYQHTLQVAIAGLCVSLLDSLFGLLVAFPTSPTHSYTAHQFGVACGMAFVMVVSVLTYAGVLIYLNTPAGEAEFSPPEQEPMFPVEIPAVVPAAASAATAERGAEDGEGR